MHSPQQKTSNVSGNTRRACSRIDDIVEAKIQKNLLCFYPEVVNYLLKKNANDEEIGVIDSTI